MTKIARGGQPWRARSASFIATSILSITLIAGAGFVAHADESSSKDQDFGATLSSVGSSEGGALGSSGTGKAPEQGDHDAFYDTDGVTTTTPGEILKTETVPYNPAPRGMKGYVPKTVDRIMYTTTNAHGELTPVTGYIMEPRAEWKGKGERPTVIIGRGTVGQGDKCAPTRNWPLHNLQDPVQSGRGVNLEGIYDVAFAKYGVRVIVTDYIGMGTDEVHTYMNRLDQAHAMIDAGRAARNIVEKNGGKFGKVAFYGHSQGGGASTAAVEEAPNYGKDLDVAGAYASAPPADLNAVQQNIDGSDLMGAIGFTINGMLARYPELRPLLEEHLNEEGEKALAATAEMCTDEIMDNFGHQETRNWTKDGRSLTELLKDMPDAQKALEDQKIGNGKPEAPVMIVSGRYDRNVEYNQAKVLAKTWRDKGASVVYKDDFMPPIGEYNHLAQAATGAPYGLDFIIARFNDLPVKGEGGDYTTESSLQGSSQSSSDGYGLLGSSQPFLGSSARD